MAQAKKKRTKRQEMICLDDSHITIASLELDILMYRMIGTPEALEEADKLEVELAKLKKRRERIRASNMRILDEISLEMELEDEYRSRLLYLLTLWIAEKEKAESEK